jgi:HEPN domain-containing protein
MTDRRAEATRWFRQADLKAARWNREGGFHDTACFLAQQAAEKALKSLLYYLGARRTALLTHSLVEMTQELAGRRDAPAPAPPGTSPPGPAAESREPAARSADASQPRDTALIAALADDARSLDLHYVPSRYPNGLPGGYPHEFYGPELSGRAIEAADRIVQAVASWYRDAGETALS